MYVSECEYSDDSTYVVVMASVILVARHIKRELFANLDVGLNSSFLRVTE